MTLNDDFVILYVNFHLIIIPLNYSHSGTTKSHFSRVKTTCKAKASQKGEIETDDRSGPWLHRLHDDRCTQYYYSSMPMQAMQGSEFIQQTISF